MNVSVAWRILRNATITTSRLYLSVIFLIYGAVKLYPGQFISGGAPYDPEKHDPMYLAWVFFGYSRWYEIFIGLGELSAAALLLFPRLRTIGALVCFPIAVNVMMVNYAFDIGVQDLSTLLCVLCVILLLADRKKFLTLLREPHANPTRKEASGS